MKILTLFVTILALFTGTVQGQTETPTSAPPPGPWKHGMVAALTLTQVSFTDWTQGGENAMAYTTTADGKSEYDMPDINWTSSYNFGFGQTRLGDQGIRKTEDRIDLGSVLTYKLGSMINPYIAFNLKTQFAKGFLFDAAGNSTEVSRFFDPGFLTQTAGVGYQPVKEVKTRLGLGVREILTSQFTQYSDDPTTTEIEKVSVNGGFESVTNVEWQLHDNILFTTQLEFFAPVKTLREIVVRDNTTLVAKITKYVTANFNIQLINEKRVTPRTQVKQSIALGLSYTLF